MSDYIYRKERYDVNFTLDLRYCVTTYVEVLFYLSGQNYHRVTYAKRIHLSAHFFSSLQFYFQLIKLPRKNLYFDGKTRCERITFPHQLNRMSTHCAPPAPNMYISLGTLRMSRNTHWRQFLELYEL